MNKGGRSQGHTEELKGLREKMGFRASERIEERGKSILERSPMIKAVEKKTQELIKTCRDH